MRILTHGNQPCITIKGTKDGLTFYIDDDTPFHKVIEELTKTLTTTDFLEDSSEQAVAVTLHLGFRYVSKEQRRKLKQLIEEHTRFYIEQFDSNVISKDEAETWFDEMEVKSLTQIVRSGQIVEVTGDLLLIGDVNPGGQVRATGNIYILGHLYGIAHAGIYGNEQATIAASYMNPTQLRIAHYLSRAPDYETEGTYMECAYLDNETDKIVIDRLQVLPYVRKKNRKIEGGRSDG